MFAARQPGQTRLDWVAGGIAAVVYLIVQLALLEGPHPFDPAKYFQTAVDFPNVSVDLWTLRIGLVGPVRAAVLLFGPSEAALYAVPLLTGTVLVASVFATMLLLFGDRVLAGATALVAGLNVNYLVNSSHIFPDSTATATFMVAFLCLLLGGRRAGGHGEGWATTAAVVCGGVLLGWSYLIREFSPILLPAVLALVLLLRYPLRRVALLAGSAAAAASVELLYGALRFGDPFAHVRMLLSRGDLAFRPGRERRIEHVQAQLDNLLDTVVVLPRLLLAWSSGWVFLLLAVVFLVALLRLRDRRLWLLGAWFLSFWAVMAVLGLVSLSSGRWIVNITNVRYWYPIFPPLLMGAFGGLWLLLRSRVPSPRGVHLAQAVAVALALVALVPGLAEFRSCAAREAWRNDPAERWHELRSWLSTPEGRQYDVIWTDPITFRLVPAYTATTFGRQVWNGRVKRLRALPEGYLRESLLLFHKDRWSSSVKEPSAWLEELRREWSPVFVSDDGRMLALVHESAPSDAGAGADGEWWDLSAGLVRQAAPGECGQSPYEPGGS